MNEAVLDASVVLKWFHTEGEAHAEEALALRHRFEAGELRVLAPGLLWLEVLNVAARRWHWPEPRLGELADTLPALGFEIVEPDLGARWAAAGLTAYDAAYVAVAEVSGVQLVTDDRKVLAVASEVAIALASLAV